jgi:hypothetical protein
VYILVPTLIWSETFSLRFEADAAETEAGRLCHRSPWCSCILSCVPYTGEDPMSWIGTDLGFVSSAQMSVCGDVMHIPFAVLASPIPVIYSDLLLPYKTKVYLCYSGVEARKGVHTELHPFHCCIEFMYLSSGSCLESREYGRRDPSRWPRGTLYPQKLAITLPTSGGCLVCIVRSRTQAMVFFFFF